MAQGSRAILSIARGVLAELDLEVVLERVLDAARELTGARYAALGVLDDSRTRLARFLTLGIDEPTRAAIGPLPTGRGVLGELIADAVPLRIADVGSHPHSYGFPPGHPAMRSFLGVPVLIDGQPFGNLYLTDKLDADEFSAEDEQAVVQLADFAAVAIDHARRYSGAESQRIELAASVEALDATLQISRALGGQTDLATILELVAKRGRALVGARTLLIEIERDGEFEVAAAAGEIPGGLLAARIPLEDSMSSAALHTRLTQRLGADTDRTRFEGRGLARFGVVAREGLFVPMIFRSTAYGVLVALDRLDGDEFTARQVALLESFAASAAAAVATAASAADERRRQSLGAAEAERGRWARELHDETLQSLAHLRLLLASAQRRGTVEALRGAVESGLAQLEVDITNLRSLITELRPAALDELGTEAAVRALAERLLRTGVEVAVSIDLAYEAGRAAERHTPELEVAMYRIVQEALTNAARHGHAQHATVEIAEGPSAVRVSVRDDGAGFDPLSQQFGFGLVGIRERCELLAGSLSVESAPGGPTTVTALLPTQRRAAPR